MSELAQEICERVEKDELENNRRPKQMVISFTEEIDGKDVASSRSTVLGDIDVVRISTDAIDIIKKNTNQFLKVDQNTVLHNPIKFLGISVGKFEDLDQKQKNTIDSMFSNQIKNNLAKKEAIECDSSELLPNACISAKDCEKDLLNQSIKPIEDKMNITDTNVLLNVKNVEIKAEAAFKPETNKSFFAKLVPPPTKKNSFEIGESSKTSFFAKLASPAKSEDSKIELNESKPQVPDYKLSYAEFQIPTNMPDLYEKCTQCSKRVLLSEIQSHNDAHFAFQLSQEQRMEFRTQTKQTTSKSPATKKIKLDRNLLNEKSTAVNSNLIQKFLTKGQTVPISAADDQTKCSECGNFISIEKITEHMDYHTAKRLQMELNKELVVQSSQSESTPNRKQKKEISSKTRIASVASYFQAPSK